MQATQTEAGAASGHRRPAALRAGSASRARGALAIANKALMADFGGRTFEAARRLKKSSSQHGIRAAEYAPLNAFFAISANSPSMSMVNFSCCVRTAPAACASRVTRGMTAQLIRAAGRTKAGAH